MQFILACRRRLRLLSSRKRAEDELEEAISFHRNLLRESIASTGSTNPAAEAKALCGNGPVTAEAARAVWGFEWLDEMGQDIRYGARTLRATPAFTVAAVASLALGIGANSAVFSLSKQILLSSLPVRDPGGLVVLRPVRNGTDTTETFAYPLLKRIAAQNTVLSGLFASSSVSPISVDLGAGTETLPSGAALVSGDFFPTLGVAASAGRLLGPSDDSVPNGHPVVVLGDGYWKQRFGASHDVIGRRMNVNGTQFTIVGIAPSGFFGLQLGRHPDVYLPIIMDSVANRAPSSREDPASWWVSAMGRLKPGVTIDQARAQIAAMVHRDLTDPRIVPDAAQRQKYAHATVSVESARGGLAAVRRQFAKPLTVLMVLVALVLLIACVNVAGLLVSRGLARRGELAIRTAIGAGRPRLVRQLLTESMLLFTIASAIGVGAAYAGESMIASVARSARWSVDIPVRMDASVLAFTAILCAVTGLLFGFLPAVWSTRVDIARALARREERGGRGTRSGSALVVAQIALSTLLVFSSALFVRSLTSLQHVDLGFRHTNLLSVEVDPRRGGYRTMRLAAFYQEVLPRLRRIPGVSAVTMARYAPFASDQSLTSFGVEGYTSPANTRPQQAYVRVDTAYFSVLGIALRAGRYFSDADVGYGRGAAAAIVNEAFEREFGSGSSIVGRHLEARTRTASISIPIVGVVGDVKSAGIRERVAPTVFLPLNGDTSGVSGAAFLLRVGSPQLPIGDAVRREIAAIDPTIEVLQTRTIDSVIDGSMTNERLIGLVAGFFGPLALVLAMTGIYGVTSYRIAQQRREIGIRMALGASRQRVLGTTLGRAVLLVVWGLAIGLPLSFAIARIGAALLYGISITDIGTTLATAVLLMACAVLAAYVPARRAARVSPLTALREE